MTVIPLLLLPCRVALAHLLERCGLNVNLVVTHVMMTLFILVSAFAFSLKVPNITLVIGLTGSSAGVALLWILPAIFYRSARKLMRFEQAKVRVSTQAILASRQHNSNYRTDENSALLAPYAVADDVETHQNQSEWREFVIDKMALILIYLGVVFSAVCTTASLYRIITYKGNSA